MNKMRIWLLVGAGCLLAQVSVAELVDSLACAPQAQYFDGVAKWWLQRFDAKRAECSTNAAVNVVFLGDSITHHWEDAGRAVWDATFVGGNYAAVNCGISSERTENLIWRIEHGQFGTARPKVFVLMIGTNNAGQKDRAIEAPSDTICGIRRIVSLLQLRYPDAKIVLHPIFPRGEKPTNEHRLRNEAVNAWIRYLGTASGFSGATSTRGSSMPTASSRARWRRTCCIRAFAAIASGRTRSSRFSTMRSG